MPDDHTPSSVNEGRGAHDAKRLDTVNRSGFPLQIRLAHVIQATADDHAFDIIAQEHPWESPDGERGFIDLVLGRDPVRLVIECKRLRATEWVFLQPRGPVPRRRHARFLWSKGVGVELAIRPGDFLHDPISHEAGFCVVTRGSGEDQQPPMLERIAGQLLRSIEALCRADAGSESPTIYVPVIVTTAALRMCLFDAKDIDLESGEMSSPNFEPVDLVRFRKGFSAKSFLPGLKPLGEMNKALEQTVLVARAATFPSLLKQFDLAPGSQMALVQA